MSEGVLDLFGSDWEDYCGNLLRHRYPPVDVQAVPSLDRGDLGIDYWIRGGGDIYQCYGPENAHNVSERLRLQKTKLHKEVKKMINNADRIAKMIAPANCKRYVFLIPRYDSKELLEYASKKTEELRSSDLPFCTNDFEISVQSLKDFSAERILLRQFNIPSPRFGQVETEEEKIYDWLTDNGEMAKTIREKIEVILGSKTPEEIDRMVNQTAVNYLEGENAMNTLRAGFPDLYERLRSIITARRRRLLVLGGQPASVPMDTIKEELDSLTETLESKEVGFNKSDAMVVSTGTIAMWLADCTLDPR